VESKGRHRGGIWRQSGTEAESIQPLPDESGERPRIKGVEENKKQPQEMQTKIVGSERAAELKSEDRRLKK